MRKVIVAGAGHGGLAAAYNLAQNGCEVTVVEKLARDRLGYDWHDCIVKSVFSKVGMDSLPEEEYLPFTAIAYYSPSKRVKMDTGNNSGNILGMIDRKTLISHLISECEKVGVSFIFGVEITGALTGAGRVTGVEYTAGGDAARVTADLVIDSAGARSPVRHSLPERFGIVNDFDESEIFHTYRAYFDNTERVLTEPRESVYFHHCRRPGMDWLITEEDFADILIGGFGELSDDDIRTALEDFRKDYPFIGEKLLRGGTRGEIPLSKPLPRIVCSGYAAVGDSAGMTDCLCGSGICSSMQAGKLLADVVNSIDGDCNLVALWRYQYEYYSGHLGGYLKAYLIKTVLVELGVDALDELLDKKVLTAKEISSGSMAIKSAKELLKKASGLISAPGSLKPIAGLGIKLSRVKAVKSGIPEKFDAVKVTEWEKLYNKI